MTRPLVVVFADAHATRDTADTVPELPDGNGVLQPRSLNNVRLPIVRKPVMHVALLGASGYVGQVFAAHIASRGDTFSPIGRSQCDVYSRTALTAALRAVSPDRLINCAGYTGKPNVDACELQKTDCLAGNSVLPGVIAEVCADLQLTWGHVSSGCIFTGRRTDGQAFSESDPPNFSFRQNNCSFYSGTKALGEEILAGIPSCYIWRLRIPFSNLDSPRNYLSKIMRYDMLLDAENSLSNLPEFVDAALDCLRDDLPFGTYNLTNPGSVRTSDVVELIQRSGVCRKSFRFFESEQHFMRTAAKTPRSNCVLDSSRAIAAGLRLTDVRESVAASLSNWKTATP